MKKYLLCLLLMVLVAVSATAQTVYRFDDNVQNVRGDAIGGAVVTVYQANTTTKASIYSGPSVALTLGNPTYTDGYGRYYFYVEAGTYDVTISGSGVTTHTVEDINFGDLVYKSTTAPDTSSTGPGMLWFDETYGQLKLYDGDGWDILNATATSPKSITWPIGTGAGAGDAYSGGYYEFASTANDFNPAVNYGDADNGYGAHIMFVAAAGSTDCVLTIIGASVTDAGVLTQADTSFVSIDDASADTYYETPEKWVGQVSIEKTSGTDRLVNYGWCKYWDNGNKDFTLTGFEAIWHAGADDTGFEVSVVHHKSTGWTYNASAAPDPPVIYDLETDYDVASQAVSGKLGAWKRVSLSDAIDGDGSEGIIFFVTTTGVNKIDYGSIQMWYTD